MLGRACEGAWVELGRALHNTGLPGKDLASEELFAQKIRTVVKGLERAQAKALLSRADVNLNDVRDAGVWTEALRDARNSVHYTVTASVDNAYEKLAMLLLACVPNLRVLYRLINNA